MKQSKNKGYNAPYDNFINPKSDRSHIIKKKKSGEPKPRKRVSQLHQTAIKRKREGVDLVHLKCIAPIGTRYVLLLSQNWENTLERDSIGLWYGDED